MSRKYDYSRFMELYIAGYRDIEISNELSIPPKAIHIHRKRRNLPVNNPPAHVVSRNESWNKDDESLFCDGDFLEKLLQKPIERVGGK